MASSSAVTVEEYLAQLPAERRAVVAAVRDVVLRAMPPGYTEEMSYGMIGYNVPLERYSTTYNGQPLSYVALAAQKNHYSLYLTCAYQDERDSGWLRGEFVRAGKAMDMGKSCLRFKSLDDLPLGVIAAFVARTSVEAFIAQYETARSAIGQRPARKR